MINVLVVCGSGVATSTLAAEKLKSLCKYENIDIETYQCKTSDVKARKKMIDPDIIVTTANLNEEFDIPVINGKALITEVGLKEFKLEFFENIVKLSGSKLNLVQNS